MISVCNVISRRNVVKESRDCMYIMSLMLSRRLAKFGGHSHCGIGDINISATTAILPETQNRALFGYP